MTRGGKEWSESRGMTGYSELTRGKEKNLALADNSVFVSEGVGWTRDIWREKDCIHWRQKLSYYIDRMRDSPVRLIERKIKPSFPILQVEWNRYYHTKDVYTGNPSFLFRCKRSNPSLCINAKSFTPTNAHCSRCAQYFHWMTLGAKNPLP